MAFAEAKQDKMVNLGWNKNVLDDLLARNLSKNFIPGFARIMPRVGEFLAQPAFTMLDHKHDRVARLLCHFDGDELMKAFFDSPPESKTYFLVEKIAGRPTR